MEAVKMYDPQIVKLDRALISDIDKNQMKQENVEALVLRFHDQGRLIVAEGVETRKEFEYLVGLGIDLFQGYYLAMPQ